MLCDLNFGIVRWHPRHGGGTTMTNSEIFMAVFTAVIATTGVIGAIIFNNQLGVMQGQLSTAKKVVELSDKTAERQLRAYVGIYDLSLRGSLKTKSLRSRCTSIISAKPRPAICNIGLTVSLMLTHLNLICR
jgi:hypothetical protein